AHRPKTEPNEPEEKQPLAAKSPGELQSMAASQPTIRRRKDAKKRGWDEASLFEELASTIGEKELEIARQIYDWMRKDGKRRVEFGIGKQDGSVYPKLAPSGITINPVVLSSNGKLYVQFGSLKDKPVFGTLDSRRALAQRFNAISNVGFTN